MKKSTSYAELVTYFGNQTITAKRLNVSQPTVSNWLNDIHGMATQTARRAEIETGGKFKAVDLCVNLDGFDIVMR